MTPDVVVWQLMDFLQQIRTPHPLPKRLTAFAVGRFLFDRNSNPFQCDSPPGKAPATPLHETADTDWVSAVFIY